MAEIKVRIEIADYPGHLPMEPLAWGTWLMGKLREAGVPVRGALRFDGVERGTLVRLDDPADFGACTYVWTEPHSQGKEND
jgi:hypothetical protein